MIHKSSAALAGVLALSACGFGGPRLDSLTEEDQAPFVGFTCTAVRDDGAILYITDGESGVIRYGGRPVRLTRFRREIPFDPASTDSLMMTSADGTLELDFRGVVQAPGTSDDATESFTRPVIVSIEERSFGPAPRLTQGADLVCAS